MKKKISVYNEGWESKPTWYAVHHRRTSGAHPIPAGSRFVQRHVRRYDNHCNYPGSNPILDHWQTLCLWLRYNSCIINSLIIDHTVFATTRVGRWLARGWVGHSSGDVTIHSFDRPARGRNDHAKPHSHVPYGNDPCTNCDHDRCEPWHWRWQ